MILADCQWSDVEALSVCCSGWQEVLMMIRRGNAGDRRKT